MDRFNQWRGVAHDLDMKRDVRGACLREGLDVRSRVCHHEVDVENGVGDRLVDGPADGRTHREVRHEVAVHHIDVQQVAARGKGGAALVAEAREVGRQD